MDLFLARHLSWDNLGETALYFSKRYIFYTAMVLASLIIEFSFQLFHLTPEHRNAEIVEMSIKLNYTTILNIIFAGVGSILLYRFWKTNGIEMLKKMK